MQYTPDHVLRGNKACLSCSAKFSLILPKHRCKVCFQYFCGACSRKIVFRSRMDVPGSPIRFCHNCAAFNCQPQPVLSVYDFGEDVLQRALRLSVEDERRRIERVKLYENIQVTRSVLTGSAPPAIPEDDEVARVVALSMEEEQMRLEKERHEKRQMEMAQVIAVLKPISKTMTGSKELEMPGHLGEDGCTTCQRQLANVFFRPCGHQVLCHGCADVLYGDRGNRPPCQVCGKMVVGIVLDREVRAK